MNKNLISPGCGYCSKELTCPKKIQFRDWLNGDIITKEDAFRLAHTCIDFDMHPCVGKSKEQLMERFK